MYFRHLSQIMVFFQSVPVSIHLSVSQSVSQTVSQSVSQSFSQSDSQSVRQSVSQSVSQSVCLSVFLAVVCLCFTYLPTYSSFHWPILLTGCLYVPACLPADRSIVHVFRSDLQFTFKPVAAVWTLLCLCSNEGEIIAYNIKLVFELSYSHATFSEYPSII
jgi:hypothetical protein